MAKGSRALRKRHAKRNKSLIGGVLRAWRATSDSVNHHTKTFRRAQKRKRLLSIFVDPQHRQQKLINFKNASTQEVSIPETSHTSSSSRITTSAFIRPDGALKSSLEGFLLDQRSLHTQKAYGKDLKRFVKYLIVRESSNGPEPLDRSVLVAYKDWLLSEKLEHTTIDRHLSTLKSVFRWLTEDELFEKSPAESVRFLSPRRISKTAGLSDEEVIRVLAQPNIHTRVGGLHYAVLMVLFYCGLRRSELCDLKTTNISVERGVQVLRLRGKGDTERILPLIPRVWNAIRFYFMIANRDFEQDAPLFMPVRNQRTGVLRKPLDPSMIFKIVQKYARRAGIQGRVSPHSCRATAISNARDHDAPDRAIQEFAGWTSPNMIVHYDKRRTAVEESAAHLIDYSKKKPLEGNTETPGERSFSGQPEGDAEMGGP